MVHPFLCYVTDPAINVRENRRERGELEVDGKGFFSGWGEPEPTPDDAVRVGVFGGSVAFVMSFAAGQGIAPQATAISVKRWTSETSKESCATLNTDNIAENANMELAHSEARSGALGDAVATIANAWNVKCAATNAT